MWQFENLKIENYNFSKINKAVKAEGYLRTNTEEIRRDTEKSKYIYYISVELCAFSVYLCVSSFYNRFNIIHSIFFPLNLSV
jgi:hypothetical protein